MLRTSVLIFLIFLCGNSYGQAPEPLPRFQNKPGYFVQYYPNGFIQHEGLATTLKKEGVQYWFNPEQILIKKVEYEITLPRIGHFNGISMIEVVYRYSDQGNNLSVEKFINGEKQPESEEFYSNGQVKYTIVPSDDNIHETYTSYFPDGQLRFREERIIGSKPIIKDGLQERWLEDGTKVVETEYSRNVKNGTHNNWSKSGQMLNFFTYRNDTVIARESWSENGEKIASWREDSPNDSHFDKVYNNQTGKLRSVSTYKQYHLDGDSIVLRTVLIYDNAGNFKEKIIGPYMSNRHGLRIAYGPFGVLKKDVVSNGTFMLELRTDHTGAKYYHLNAYARPLQMGFWIANHLRFEYSDNLDEQNDVILKAVREVESNLKKGNAYNHDHIFDVEHIPAAKEYYLKYPKLIFFDTMVVTSKFDESETGDYRIDYPGTEMYYLGHLDNGLEHGTSILFLNDSIKLFEREYRHGMLHGLSKEWNLDGTLAQDVQYFFGQRVDEISYFRDGPVAKRERKEYRGATRLIEEWGQDRKPVTLEWEEDSVRYAIRYDKISRELVSFNWHDKKRGIGISHSIFKGRDFVSNNIPHVVGDTVYFAIDKYGIHISGKSWWNEAEKKTELIDNFGKVASFDRTVISYPKVLPCECGDWTDSDFFAVPTKNYASLEKFRKYQLDFHAPSDQISTVFGNPYYMTSEPEGYNFGETYTVYSNFFGVKPLELQLPDTTGITFTLEPCKSRFAFYRFKANVEFKSGFPKETKLNIYDPKTLGLTIPNNILVQVDDNFQSIVDGSGALLPGMFLFDAEEVQYNKEKELNVVHPSLSCAKPMAIGNSGLVLEAHNLLPDFSRTENYEAMNYAMARSARSGLLGIAPLNQEFTGAFIHSGVINFPIENENSEETPDYFAFYIEDVAASHKELRATLRSASYVANNGELTLHLNNDRTMVMNQSQLESYLATLELASYKLIFNVGEHAVIHLNYLPK